MAVADDNDDPASPTADFGKLLPCNPLTGIPAFADSGIAVTIGGTALAENAGSADQNWRHDGTSDAVDLYAVPAGGTPITITYPVGCD